MPNAFEPGQEEEPTNKAIGTLLREAFWPSELWCADFKGEFKTDNGRYCYPLMVTDQASRCLLLAAAREATREVPVIKAIAHRFR